MAGTKYNLSFFFMVIRWIIAVFCDLSQNEVNPLFLFLSNIVLNLGSEILPTALDTLLILIYNRLTGHRVMMVDSLLITLP